MVWKVTNDSFFLAVLDYERFSAYICSKVKNILPRIPKGPAFRDVMEEQENWMIVHPGAGKEFLAKHLVDSFSTYT